MVELVLSMSEEPKSKQKKKKLPEFYTIDILSERLSTSLFSPVPGCLFLHVDLIEMLQRGASCVQSSSVLSLARHNEEWRWSLHSGPIS